MPWHDDEWGAFCLLLEEGWPGDFDDRTQRAWRVLLDRHDPQEVIAAVQHIVAEGHTFRPSVSEVVAAIRRDPTKPAFAEVIQLIYGRGGILRARPTVTRWATDHERRHLEEEAAWSRATELHPLVAAFARAQGLERLRRMNLDDPDWGDKRRADLQREWDDFAGRTDDRQAAALAAGQPPRAGLRQFDPLAALGVGEQTPRPALAEENTR